MCDWPTGAGWDIGSTREELEEQLENALVGLKIDGIDEERPIGGFPYYDDLSIIEPDDLMEMGGLTREQVDHIVRTTGSGRSAERRPNRNVGAAGQEEGSGRSRRSRRSEQGGGGNRSGEAAADSAAEEQDNLSRTGSSPPKPG